MTDILSNPLLIALATLAGVGLGWYLGRKSRKEDQEHLRKLIESTGGGCWVRSQVVVSARPDKQ